MKLTGEPGGVEALAEEAVVAACMLADAADPSRWSAGAGAVEDVAAALDVLVSALTQLDPECAEILSVVPVAAAAVVERAEQASAGAGESNGGRAMAGTSTALRQALAAHGLTRHRVHQFDARAGHRDAGRPRTQALAMLFSRRDALPRRAQQRDVSSLFGRWRWLRRTQEPRVLRVGGVHGVPVLSRLRLLVPD
ncbi:hypothetical protein C6N75_10510 [Streptomyces solincola]|uniref:Uncharacterized protein n=1 Tax=Streptomyces solincola TaxID=2100817 RepID=A0A2S9PXU1_9ACTN|nr:hypothetical protein C6N75_10510 [Streptomyces solincola]